jgi:hypothetical protein
MSSLPGGPPAARPLGSDVDEWDALFTRIRLRDEQRERAWQQKRRREAESRFARSELARGVPIPQVAQRTPTLTRDQLRRMRDRIEYRRRGQTLL